MAVRDNRTRRIVKGGGDRPGPKPAPPVGDEGRGGGSGDALRLVRDGGLLVSYTIDADGEVIVAAEDSRPTET